MHQQSEQNPSRRDFLKKTAFVAGGAALGSGLSIARSAHAAGNGTFKIALVGCGGRGTGAAVNAIKNAAGANVQLVAMADAFRARLDNSLASIQKLCPGHAAVREDLKFAGLESAQQAIQSDVDLVMLCSPPGFRPRDFEAAVAAGKNIFMEKPVCVDGPGYRRVLAANEQAKQKKLMVAVGLNGRHSQPNRDAVRQIHDGVIGPLQFCRAYYNAAGVWVRPRDPEETEMQYQVKNWYYFTWLSGDQIVEQHVHSLDAVNWMMKDAHPIEANGMGGRQVRIGKDYGEIYDHFAVEYTYPDGAKMFSFSRHIPKCWNTTDRFAHGVNGSVQFARTGTAICVNGKEPVKIPAEKVDSHQTEHDHLFAALLKGETYNEADYGAAASMTAVLGRMACYSGKVVTWDEAVGSTLDLSPPAYTWDAKPQPTCGSDGLYPCAMPGVTKAV
jgi:myo-inositol 2-dehydrogenase / D-chiro-inositol 1-dehydrogenase